MKTTRARGDRFEVYVTKYALTSGVTKRLVEDIEGGHVRSVESEWSAVYGPGDWQETEAGAIARVREMLDAKRKSLAKQAARLDAIEKDPLGAAKRDPVYGDAGEAFEAHGLNRKANDGAAL